MVAPRRAPPAKQSAQRALRSVPATVCPPQRLVRECLGPLGSRPLTQLTPCTCPPCGQDRVMLALAAAAASASLVVNPRCGVRPCIACRAAVPQLRHHLRLFSSENAAENKQEGDQGIHSAGFKSTDAVLLLALGRRPPVPAQAAGEATFRLSTPALSSPAATLGLAPCSCSGAMSEAVSKVGPT